MCAPVQWAACWARARPVAGEGERSEGPGWQLLPGGRRNPSSRPSPAPALRSSWPPRPRLWRESLQQRPRLKKKKKKGVGGSTQEGRAAQGREGGDLGLPAPPASRTSWCASRDDNGAGWPSPVPSCPGDGTGDRALLASPALARGLPVLGPHGGRPGWWRALATSLLLLLGICLNKIMTPPGTPPQLWECPPQAQKQTV